ncbi:MAG: tyrosine-type recombinase/integrase, partial [Anaerolineaceae bacterium]
ETLRKLADHRNHQAHDRIIAGNRWRDMDLVFTSQIGTPVDPRNLQNDFKKLLKHAGLPNMRFHDLRHTSITLVLNEVKAPIKEAQRRAGHTRPSTTMDIYGGEASSKLDQIVAQGLDDLITPIEVELHRNCTEEKKQ